MVIPPVTVGLAVVKLPVRATVASQTTTPATAEFASDETLPLLGQLPLAVFGKGDGLPRLARPDVFRKWFTETSIFAPQGSCAKL